MMYFCSKVGDISLGGSMVCGWLWSIVRLYLALRTKIEIL